MSWLDSHNPQQPKKPNGLAHMPGHMPSALHHTSGVAHEFREKLGHAVTLGDFTAIHAVITEGEQHHLVPKTVGTMLDILWESGPNTHDERLGLSAAINNAVQIAKLYNQISDMLTEAAATLPQGPARDKLREQVPSLVVPILDLFGKLPAARKAKIEVIVGHLTSML